MVFITCGRVCIIVLRKLTPPLCKLFFVNIVSPPARCFTVTYFSLGTDNYEFQQIIQYSSDLSLTILEIELKRCGKKIIFKSQKHVLAPKNVGKRPTSKKNKFLFLRLVLFMGYELHKVI